MIACGAYRFPVDANEMIGLGEESLLPEETCRDGLALMERKEGSRKLLNPGTVFAIRPGTQYLMRNHCRSGFGQSQGRVRGRV